MRLRDVLRRQDGVISRAQAVACGLSTRTVQRRVASGRWVDVLPGVYLADGHPLNDRARVRAAWLWAGPSAVVSGPAAAFCHGLLPHMSGPIQVTVPRSITRRSRGWVQVRRRDLADTDRLSRNGIGVTAVPLTVLETAVSWPDGPAVLDRALHKGRVRFGDLHEAYCRSAGVVVVAHRSRPVPGRPDEGERARPGRVARPAFHLGRPDPPPRRRRRPDQIVTSQRSATAMS